MWLDMKENRPDEFAEAAQFEKDFQGICRGGGATQVPYLHETLVSITRVDFAARMEAKAQKQALHWKSKEAQAVLFPDGFGNECEGMCGV